MEKSQNNEEKYVLKRRSCVWCIVVFAIILIVCLPEKGVNSFIKEKVLGLTTEQKYFLKIIDDNCTLGANNVERESQKEKEQSDTCLVKLMSGYLARAVDSLVLKAVEEKRHELIDSVKRAFLRDSVSVYLTSIIQTEERYKVYYVIYRIHFDNVDRYALCRILKSTKRRDRDINEIRLVKESGSLMDLAFQSSVQQPKE